MPFLRILSECYVSCRARADDAGHIPGGKQHTAIDACVRAPGVEAVYSRAERWSEGASDSLKRGYSDTPRIIVIAMRLEFV